MKNQKVSIIWTKHQVRLFPFISHATASNAETFLTLEQIHQYIKTGEHEKLITLQEVSKMFEKRHIDWDKTELASILQGIPFSTCKLDELNWQKPFTYSGLIAFEFRPFDHSEFENLQFMLNYFDPCTVMRFENHFNGTTVILNANPLPWIKIDFPYKAIAALMEEIGGISPVKHYDDIEHITVLNFDPCVYFNPLAVSFFDLAKQAKVLNAFREKYHDDFFFER